MVRDLLVEKPQALQISLLFIDLLCTQDNTQIQSLHFISNQLLEVEFNILATFVMMNKQVPKCHGKFCLVSVCFLECFKLVLSSIKYLDFTKHLHEYTSL